MKKGQETIQNDTTKVAYGVVRDNGSGIFLILLAEPLSRLFAMDNGETGTYKLMLVFSNFGFMGFPLIKTMFGAEGINA